MSSFGDDGLTHFKQIIKNVGKSRWLVWYGIVFITIIMRPVAAMTLAGAMVVCLPRLILLGQLGKALPKPLKVKRHSMSGPGTKF